MNISESIELGEIWKRVRGRKATRKDIERGRELAQAKDAFSAREFERAVADMHGLKYASDKTATERKRAQREREQAFDISDKPGDVIERGFCRMDLARFGWTYCRNLLRHKPSKVMVESLIYPLQNTILFGGMHNVQFPRGTGKTTWMKIAMIWAVLYGHKRFIMTIAATRDHAKAINEQILLTLEASLELRRDFPAITVPIVGLAGNWRKASTQKYEGRPTRMVNSDGYIVLPSVYKSGTDELVEEAAGAVFYTAGIHGAIRGIAREKQRPDLIFFDDPQTREEAESASSSDKLERLIEGDALGNFGQDDVRSCIMAITPIRPGDIASRFADRRLHPTWGSSKQAYIIEKSANFDALFPAYREAYADDVAAQKDAIARGEVLTADLMWARSTRFYVENKDAFAGTVVIDECNFNKYEIDAIHHILNVKAAYRDQSLFDAELQMDVSGELCGDILDPDEVMRKINGIPCNILPPGTYDCVAFIDVNTQQGAGLRWGVLAFGPNRVTALVNRGAFPEDGSALVPPHSPPGVRNDLIKRGIRSVVRTLMNLPLRHPNGTRVWPLACAVDAGYASDVVHEVTTEIANTVKLHGMQLFCTLGRNWRQFKNLRRGEERDIVSKDHLYSGVTVKRVNGRVWARKYIGIHSDYWREIAQKALMVTPLESGSLSLYGNEPAAHREFANEVCYEKLVRTYREEVKPFRQAWEWVNDNPGHNHSLDILYGCFAVACWIGVYSADVVLPPSARVPCIKGVRQEWANNVPVATKPHIQQIVRKPARRFITRFRKK